jgi:hypothetical protein
MPTVNAHFFTTFSTRCAGLIGGELVGLALLVGGTPPFTGNLLLTMGIHRGKASIPRSAGSCDMTGGVMRMMLLLCFHDRVTPFMRCPAGPRATGDHDMN